MVVKSRKWSEELVDFFRWFGGVVDREVDSYVSKTGGREGVRRGGTSKAERYCVVRDGYILAVGDDVVRKSVSDFSSNFGSWLGC
jgi:hypothetical protein